MELVQDKAVLVADTPQSSILTGSTTLVYIIMRVVVVATSSRSFETQV